MRCSDLCENTCSDHRYVWPINEQEFIHKQNSNHSLGSLHGQLIQVAMQCDPSLSLLRYSKNLHTDVTPSLVQNGGSGTDSVLDLLI